MSKELKVFAPASVANVAVGFDILGFALEKPGDEIIIREGKQTGLVITEITGDKGKLSREVMQNTATFGAYRLMEELGETSRPIEMEIHKKMPLGSGIGSSAASAAAGVLAMNEFLQTGLSKEQILKFAVEAEQIADGAYHADNVAPSLIGGLILIRDNPTLDIIKLPVPENLCVAIILPDIEILTKDSRNILSDTVPLKTVIEQSGNLAAFIAAIYTSDSELLSRCTKDVIIEPQRSKLIPHFDVVKDVALENGALGFSISGAGPAMFALCDKRSTAETIAENCYKLLKDKNIHSTCFTSAINKDGAVVC